MRSITRSGQPVLHMTVTLLLAGVLAATTAGCTSSTSSCVNGRCTVSLSGEGADVELGDDDVPLELVSTEESSAVLRYDGEEVTVRLGETAAVGGVSITADEIGDMSVKLTVQ